MENKRGLYDLSNARYAELPAAQKRHQSVLNALLSRRIAGSKINLSSMSLTVSRLKSAGIAEEHGKKVRLTAYCLSAWGNMKKEDR